MATPNYDVNYDDKRFQAVEAQEKTELTKLEKTYGDMVAQTDSYYEKLANQSQEWADKQAAIQNEQTDFAIEKIEQQREQAKKDYIKEQSGAYVDWQKQSNQYGANAEAMAAQGMQNTGYSESSQVSMYNTYQNRVATARDAMARANLNFDNGIKEAQLQNSSALAQIYADAHKEQLTLALEGFQYKNSLISELTDKKLQTKTLYYNKWQDVLQQINTENALAEEVRQYNATLAEQQRQHNAEMAYKNAALAEEKRQFDATMAYNKSKSSGGSSGEDFFTLLEPLEDLLLELPEEPPLEDLFSGSSSNQIDMQSVLALGYGPISAAKLSSLVDSGIIEQYTSGGKIKFRKTASTLKQENIRKLMG